MNDAEKRKTVKKELLRYEENRAAAIYGAAGYDLTTFNSDFSRISPATNRNGVEDAVINAIDKTNRAVRWCKVFERTYERYRFDNVREKFIRLVFLKKLSAWRVCDQIGISRSTYFNMMRRIVEVATLWAAELHLIDPLENPIFHIVD